MFKTIQGWWRREEGCQQMPELTLAVTRLMVGMMSIDGKIDDVERQQIVTMISEQFGLSSEESNDLIAQAIESDLPSNLVVKSITDNYSAHERAAILARLWRVAIADGDIDFLEEQYINRTASLIDVPTEALNELKAKQEAKFPNLNQSHRHEASS